MLRRKWLRYEPFEEDAARVVGDEVVFGDHVVAGLQQQAHRREPAVAHEAVAPEDEALRVHQRHAGRAGLERVVLEHVVVREHVVQPVAQVARAVAAHDAVRRRLDVHAVAGADDLVVREVEALAVPDVDAAADLSRRAIGNARHGRVFDRGVVGLAQVDAEERVTHAAVADGDMRRRSTWMPEVSRPRSPPRRPSMSRPSRVTPAARTRTTLPCPEPRSSGRPTPTSVIGRSRYRSPSQVPAGTSIRAPAAAPSTSAWSGEVCCAARAGLRWPGWPAAGHRPAPGRGRQAERPDECERHQGQPRHRVTVRPPWAGRAARAPTSTRAPPPAAGSRRPSRRCRPADRNTPRSWRSGGSRTSAA